MVQILLTGNGNGTQSRVANDPSNIFPINLGTGYTPGDTWTAAGGTLFGSPTILNINTTQVSAVALVNGGSGGTPGPQTVTGTTGTGVFFSADVIVGSTPGPCTGIIDVANPGNNYNGGDTITIAGGTFTSPVVLTVNFTTAVSVSIVNPGTGGTPGVYDLGQFRADGGLSLFDLRLNGTIDNTGGLVSVQIFQAGQYSANPPDVSNVTLHETAGIGLTGASVSVNFGVFSASLTDPGNYSVVPNNPVSQASTSGIGTGAEFDLAFQPGPIISVVGVSPGGGGSYTVNPTDINNEPVTGAGLSGAILSIEMGVETVTLINPGSYIIPPTIPISQGATSGTGIGATFNIAYGGDPLSGIVGMSVSQSLIDTEFYSDNSNNTTTTFDDPSFTFGTLSVFDATIGSGANDAQNNGTELTPLSSTEIGNPGFFNGGISVQIRNTDGTNTLSCDLKEIRIISRTLNSTERDTIRNEIKSYFGIS
jgi:hypothetical protein